MSKTSFDDSPSKEIGGYFGLEQLINNGYYKNLLPLNTGRNALLYLLKAKSIKKLYIPYYLCDSISDMLDRNNYDYEYYNVDENFKPIFCKTLCKDEYLYIVNYFGQISNEDVTLLKKRHCHVILDNVLAFFQRPLKGIDTIYSCRKFFGVPDGAYLSTDSKIGEEFEFASSKDRMKHLLGRYEGNAFDYFHDFQINEISYAIEPLRYMSMITKNILGAIDFKKVLQIRNKNYAYLESRLRSINKLRLTTPYGAFAYPFYVENGIEFRKKLAEYNIYIPTLWPNVLKNNSESSVEYQYAANILPLPCDQRYCEKDLDFMCNKILHLNKSEMIQL